MTGSTWFSRIVWTVFLFAYGGNVGAAVFSIVEIGRRLHLPRRRKVHLMHRREWLRAHGKFLDGVLLCRQRLGSGAALGGGCGRSTCCNTRSIRRGRRGSSRVRTCANMRQNTVIICRNFRRI